MLRTTLTVLTHLNLTDISQSDKICVQTVKIVHRMHHHHLMMSNLTANTTFRDMSST